jgi:hypothetical protein
MTDTKHAPEHDRRERIRGILKRHDPGTLAFMDAARGTFGEGVHLAYLSVPVAGYVAGTPIRLEHENGDGV